MKNIIRVNVTDHAGRSDVLTFENCSFILDNCDRSIRIEKKSETVAHFDNWTTIRQDIVR
jgi:hypothetical protein